MPNFSVGTGSFWKRAIQRKTKLCLIQGHSVASCKALYQPLGSIFLLDILSLMNCHSSNLRLHRGSWPMPGHTQCDHSSCPASFALCRATAATGTPKLEFLCVCVLPSLISDHTHLLTCDRQPLPIGSVLPFVFCTALRHLLVVRQMGWKFGELQSQLLEENKRLPQQSYATGLWMYAHVRTSVSLLQMPAALL